MAPRVGREVRQKRAPHKSHNWLTAQLGLRGGGEGSSEPKAQNLTYLVEIAMIDSYENKKGLKRKRAVSLVGGLAHHRPVLKKEERTSTGGWQDKTACGPNPEQKTTDSGGNA